MRLGFFTACLPGLPLDDVVGRAGTFVGRHPGRTVADNLKDAEQVFKPLVERAGERGVTLVIENCPMVEHEDPVWGGDPDRVKAGLEIAQRALRPLIVR
jgi:hypothetical protein